MPLSSVGFVAMLPDPTTLGKPTMWTLVTQNHCCLLLTEVATSGEAGETNPGVGSNWRQRRDRHRSEEHTSELQSR
jgi:hypothetical protein